MFQSLRPRPCLSGCARLTVVLLLAALAAGPARAQKKSVDCSPPRGVSRASEVSTLIREGEQECERAEDILDQARSLRDRGEDLRKEAVRFRRAADDERKEIRDLRKSVEDRRERIDALQRELLDLEAETRRYDDLVDDGLRAEGGIDAGHEAPANPIDPGDLVPNIIGRPDSWQASLTAFREAMIRYTDTRRAAIEEEIKAFEGMIQMDEEMAADREVTAVDLEQLALNSERTAMDAEAAARYAEDAATVAEEAAVRSILRACSEYIVLNLEEDRSRRNVNRAIDYIEEHLPVLPLEEASEMRDVVARGREAFDLR